MNKIVMFYVIGLLVLLSGGVYLLSPKNKSETASSDIVKKAREQCVDHTPSLSMHIHQELEIYVDGEKQTIPTNIGITDNCMMAIHTHDETGKIHLEYPSFHEFTLEDFFANWGQPLSREGFALTMTVDGQESTEVEKLVLKDLQKIIINYEKI